MAEGRGEEIKEDTGGLKTEGSGNGGECEVEVDENEEDLEVDVWKSERRVDIEFVRESIEDEERDVRGEKEWDDENRGAEEDEEEEAEDEEDREVEG